MNKEEIKERINELPLFEKRHIKIKIDKSYDENFFNEENYEAICEIGKQTPFAFVRKNYELIQFNEIFNPLVDEMQGDVEGYVINYGGFAQIILFPDDPNMSYKDGRFGIIAMNSVDCSSSIIVKFCVEHEHMRISIPPSVAGLKKRHTKNVKGIVKNYATLIGKVKDFWERIITQFPEYKVTLNDEEEGKTLNLNSVIEKLKVGERLGKVITKRYEDITYNEGNMTLWDVFVTAIDNLNEKDYKSEVHKERRLDKLSKAVFEYAIALSL